MRTIKIEFTVRKQRVAGDLHLPDGSGPFPCVVTSHGYKSHRGGRKYIRIASIFPQEGIAILRFDHRGSGESEGDFENVTLTGRVEDLEEALHFLKNFREIDKIRLGLLGSSLGGMTILALPHIEKIKAIVLIATPVSFPELDLEARECLEKQGYYNYPDGTRIRKGFFDDIRKYDFLQEAKKINCPLLIIHGYSDEVVPYMNAELLYNAAQSKVKDLKLIEEADHAFSDPDKMNEVLSLSLKWFKKHL